MRKTLPLLLVVLILAYCQTNRVQKINNTTPTVGIIASGKPSEMTSNFQGATECDSIKFPDFKSNLQEVELKITSELINKIDSIAHRFIRDQCKQDTLHCDDINLKDRRHYRSSLGLELFSFAYVLKNSDTGMEKESASFFVFGVEKNGKLIFHDIAYDLIGEIQLKLLGLEQKNNRTTIWGEMYPYFSSDDYGKFKLMIDGQESSYEFQCKSKGH